MAEDFAQLKAQKDRLIARQKTSAPRRVVFFLDYSEFKKLRKMAYDRNKPMSELIRRAVGAWLTPQKETE